MVEVENCKLRPFELFFFTNLQVRCLVRNESDISGLPSVVEIVYGDITEVETLIPAFKNCQGVIHAAACVDTWAKDETIFEKVWASHQ